MRGLLGRSATLALVSLRVAIAAIAIYKLWAGPVLESDVLRFHEVGTTAGVPYVDHDVEYAPLELILIDALTGGTPAATGTGLVIAALAGDLAAAAAVWWGWGRRAATAYLLVGTPLLVFVYYRFDPVTVALAAWGAALCARDRPVAGGLGFGAAVMAKLWPLSIVAVLVVRLRRAAIVAIATAAVGAIVWVGLTTPSAPLQVLTFRGATGWGVESPIGTAVWIASGDPVRLEGGAPRIGSVPGWATPVLAAALAGTMLAIGRAARRSTDDPFGTPSLGAVGALLTLSPLFSLQYAAWLGPWAAIADADGDRRALPLTAAATTMTGVLYALYGADLFTAAKVVLVFRAVIVVGLVAAVFVPRRPAVAGAG